MTTITDNKTQLQAEKRYLQYYDENRNPYHKCEHHIHKNDGVCIRFKTYVKTGGHCSYCGVKLLSWHLGMKDILPKMHIDHVYPKSKGGMDVITNYMPSCETCNMQKSNYGIEEFRDLFFSDGRRGFSNIRPLTPDDDGTFFAEGLGFSLGQDEEYSVDFDPSVLIHHIISNNWLGFIPNYLLINPYFGETYACVKQHEAKQLIKVAANG